MSIWDTDYILIYIVMSDHIITFVFIFTLNWFGLPIPFHNSPYHSHMFKDYMFIIIYITKVIIQPALISIMLGWETLSKWDP